MSAGRTFDFLVIGGGIAGASVAAHLAGTGSVAILEGEKHAGYHSTGRSAALFAEIYGSPLIRALTRASRAYLFDPPDEFFPHALVQSRGTLFFAREDQLASLLSFKGEAGIADATVALSAEEVLAHIPIFKPGYVAAALLDTDAADIDVNALHQGFLRIAKKSGAHIFYDSAVLGLEGGTSGWTVRTARDSYRAGVVINAAGAWADEIGSLAGAAHIGFRPLRRTALIIGTPRQIEASHWPAAIDIDEQFYFKPESGNLLLSPADEELVPACDVQPEEIDIAIAVDRFEMATGEQVSQVKRRWAGLRVFSPDRNPVVGFDPEIDGLFWLAGQGGYGIQTSSALGRAAAALASRTALPADLVSLGVNPEELSPGRFPTRPGDIGHGNTPSGLAPAAAGSMDRVR